MIYSDNFARSKSSEVFVMSKSEPDLLVPIRRGSDLTGRKEAESISDVCIRALPLVERVNISRPDFRACLIVPLGIVVMRGFCYAA